MINLSMFNELDKERADKELACYDYLMMNALQKVANGEFGKAAAYHENVAYTLNELQKMKNAKDLRDEAKELLRQIEDQEKLRRHWL